MFNGILLFVEILLCFGGIVAVKRFLGKEGLFAWITIATCLAEIQVCKGIRLFGIDTSMGNVLFASTFLCTDILRECYGQEYAKKGPVFSLLGALTYVIFAIVTPLAKPASFDLVQNSMKQLFAMSIRVTSASILMLFVANALDVWLYNKLFQKTKGKAMWLRNNVCTIICNCSENFFFTFLGFFGIYDMKTVVTISVSASIIEIIIALCDTPFLYLAKRIK